ncbi:CGNR zinc finger domain-containing protein [Actinomadura sp. 9N407]|uniref:CGNR zinc finger domain-containing protein n=1 Tax=Actinomadura sp. 9N407 TaxID=3375154 RepID=UPI00378DB48B
MIDRPLTGEPLALDLVNTRWPAGGRDHDVFDDPAAFGEWLTEHGLVPPAGQGYRRPLLEARDAIRRFLEEGSPDGVNAVLDHGRLALSLDRDRPAERIDLDDEDWRPAWETARALVELLRTASPDRLRRCAGHDCVLWFLDTSRNGRRRWCSMTGCGNRAKARAHYVREKGD